MTSIIISLLCIYFISKVYETIAGKKPQFNIDSDKILKSLALESGVWSFLIPITSALIFLYNVLASIIWMISVFVNFILFLVKWIWTEVIIAGFYLVFKIIWHYFIFWPWNLFINSFMSIKPSLKWKNLKISFFGLSYAFLIIFLGNFLVSHFEWNSIIRHFFNLFSIIPIGIAIYKITKPEGATKNSNYLINLLYLIGVFSGVILLEVFILYVGSLSTNYSYALSSLFVGGSIIGSGILIFNSILLIFTLSALPSFSHAYVGSRKTFLIEFGKHLIHKWPQYILAMPCMVLPIIIASIAPYFLGHGAAFVSKNITSQVYSQRINTIESELKSSSDYLTWMDYHKISDDSMTNLMKLDKIQLGKIIEHKTIKNNMDCLNNFYDKHSNYLTATPIFLLYKGYEMYQTNLNGLIKMNPYSSISTKENQKDTSSITKTIINLKVRIAENDKNIEEANAKLKAVCDTTRQIVSSEVENIAQIDSATSISTTENYDVCEVERDMYKKSIENYTNEKAQNVLSKKRAEIILAHFNSLNNQMTVSTNALKTSGIVGYIIISVWLCFLMAFTLAAALSLYAIINNRIFNNIDENKKWFIVQEIETANQSNPNQPFLGLGVVFLIVAFSLMGVNQFISKVISKMTIEVPFNADSKGIVAPDSISVNNVITSEIVLDSISSVSESEILSDTNIIVKYENNDETTITE